MESKHSRTERSVNVVEHKRIYWALGSLRDPNHKGHDHHENKPNTKPPFGALHRYVLGVNLKQVDDS